MQPSAENSGDEKSPRPWIRVRDQGSLLILAACALVMTWSYWRYYGGQQGSLVDVDRAIPLEARFQVDVNRADWPEMLLLPGLGKTLARRILSERQQHGPFRDLDELVRVPGIGPKTLERIRPYLLPIPQDTDWAAAGLQQSQRTN